MSTLCVGINVSLMAVELFLPHTNRGCLSPLCSGSQGWAASSPLGAAEVCVCRAAAIPGMMSAVASPGPVPRSESCPCGRRSLFPLAGGSQQGRVCPPGDIRQCQETFLVILTWGVLLAPRGPGMLQDTPLCSEQPCTTEKDLVQDVSCAGVESPCSR